MAIVQLAALDQPPARFAAGADAVQTFTAKARDLLAQANAHLALSTNLAHDEAALAAVAVAAPPYPPIMSSARTHASNPAAVT